MELTPKEQKRLNRVERIAHLGRYWVYLLVAMLILSVGIALATILQPSLPNQKLWFRTWILISAVLSMILKHQRDTRFLVEIIKRLEHKQGL